MATMAEPQHFMKTSGETDPVWIHTEPYSKRPQFTQLGEDTSSDVCIIGAGIAGITTAYELVQRGVGVLMLEAREVLSGETGRTSGHLSSALDHGYGELIKKHGKDGARAAAESQQWAITRIGDIAKELSIECEYRMLPAYHVSEYPTTQRKEHDEQIEELGHEMSVATELGLSAHLEKGLLVKGWDGKVDQRDAGVFEKQATFHPTKYLNGVLGWLKEQPNFRCYTRTRVVEISERGIEVLGFGNKDVKITTEGGNIVTCKNAVEATCVPLQKLSVVAEMEFFRTYCIALRIPKGVMEDVQLYDEGDPYKYVRLTRCDDKDDYMIVGGCDHKVGQEPTSGRFEELEQWTRDRFTKVGSVDYKWSGQIFESVDGVAFIGLNQGNKHTYVVTGDCGNGLTHGTIAGRLIADEIQGVSNPWATIYNPKRLGSIIKSGVSMLQHDLQINAQYKRFLQSDINDIEDIVPGEGGVLNETGKRPIAVYKTEDGKVHKMDALCTHMKGVLCWNSLEKSWDCPVHASRFSKEGICIMGPALKNLEPYNEAGQVDQDTAKTGS